MKSEYLSDSRTTEGRQYLQRRRQLKPVHYKNGDFDSDLALAMQESLKLARQKEIEKDIENRVLPNGTILDEIPATKMAEKINNFGGGGDVVGNQESKDLKDLLLLHVELIQHQGDLLAKKDKEIKDLISEKQTLECRLERMERRMSLLKQKDEGHHEVAEEKDTTEVTMAAKPVDRGVKRKSTLHLGSPTPSKLPGRRPGRTPNSQSKPRDRYPRKPTDVSREPKPTESPATTPSLTGKLRQQPNCTEDKGVLSTDGVYHVHESQLRSRHIEIIDKSQAISNAQSQKEIEVPLWRIIKYTNLYQMEGTENLEDDTIIKRHQKPELEEKRRKRWDIQRMREQKTAMKLRVRENSTSSDHLMEIPQDIDSFLPVLDDITHIEVVDKLPVIAFGHPLPSLEKQEFSLPWECDKLSANKRHSTARSRRK